MRPRFFVCVLVACIVHSGCATLIPPKETAQSERRCTSRTNTGESTRPPAPLGARTGTSDINLLFSPDAVSIAEIIDIEPLLDDLAVLSRKDRRRTIEFLELRQQVTDRVLLALFEVSSGVAEVVCERDRADQVSHRMDEIDSSRVKGLTLASIVLGGVAAIVSGGIGLAGGATTASDAVEVAGGAVSSGFGVMALMTKSKQEFKHERNLLSEIWNDPPQSSLLSPAVWRFLHRRHKKEEKTPREQLIAAWRQEGRLGKPGSEDERKRIDLFFGPGGTYRSADLHARASMLEELEATIQLMNQELEVLVRELTKVGGNRKPG